MNRRALLRGLLVAPIAAAAAPFLPRADIGAAFASIAEACRRATAGMLSSSARMRAELDKATIIPMFTREWITTKDPRIEAALYCEAERIMQASKLRLPALPPAHPMCRCTIVPEGAYLTIHEDESDWAQRRADALLEQYAGLDVTVHGGTAELPTIYTRHWRRKGEA